MLVVPFLSLGCAVVVTRLHPLSTYIILLYIKTHYNTMEKVLFVVCIPHLSHLPTLSVVKHLVIWEDKALPLALPRCFRDV